MNGIKVPVLEPAILVIFGITGDLSKRYLLPSLYHLIKYDLLHEKTEIIGLTRQNIQIDELLSTIELCVSEVDGVCDPVAVNKIRKRLRLRTMDMTDADEYRRLYAELNEIEDSNLTHMNRLYYLSVPPIATHSIIKNLGENGLNMSCQHGKAETRLLAEKPFGNDLLSARELIRTTEQYFKDSQIYRIDHYLAKETVQNILAFRFNNPIFEPLWNSEHVAYIEIMAHENLDIEGRVNFYERIGAMRDLIQSHLLQVLALVTMEQPIELTSEKIHNNKLRLLTQIETMPEDKVYEYSVRGQYNGYRQEVSNEASNIETYAALRISIANDRWKNTPMILKTGKALKEKRTEVNIVFKPTESNPHHNVLTFRIQPKEGIELSLRIKKPSFDYEIQPVEMDFDYKKTFSDGFNPSPYERVLVDAARGDHTLFATGDEIIEAWRVVDPVLRSWTHSADGLVMYEKNSIGPDTSKLYA